MYRKVLFSRRLCQSEMSKKAANLLKLTITLQSEARGEPGPSIRYDSCRSW